MKGRPLILIFLFLILLLNPAAASTTETFERSGADSFSATPPSGGTGTENSHGYNSLIFKNIENFQGLSYVFIIVPQTWWKGTPVAESTSTTLSINSVQVGTGTYQYNQLGSGDYRLVLIVNDDWDVSAHSGLVSVTIDQVNNIDAGYSVSAEKYSSYHNIQPANSVCFANGVHTGTSYTVKVTHTGYTEYDFINSYTYYKDGIIPCVSVEKYTSPSDWTVETENSVEIHGDTSTNMVDFIASGTPENSTFDLTVLDDYGNTYTDTIYFSGASSGYINFNQSHYTDPENIEIDYEITAFNADIYNYKFQMTATLDNNVDSNFWEAPGSWNTTTSISSSTGAAVFDISAEWYDDLPIWIRAEIWAQDKNTGIWTKLDSTPAVIYHESAVQGQIWTDKLNYNVTELVEISYTTNVAENYIAVEEPYSLWSTHDVPVGTYSFMYELSTSAVGNTTIYLFENSELVDQVIISVSSESGDDAYAAWMKDYYFEGETASFYYYSSNTSAQIIVYDGADVVIFGPATTQLGYHNGMVNTANTNPGTFLVSLYHNGTYYNDTMIFESVDSWVRFDSSKYYVGDTINIEYYLADPRHAISMWDAHNKLVIRFTTEHGRVVSGSMETVSFTLSENNEYSYDILGRLDSGYHTLGYWKIFIEDEYGALDTWDETYVCNATDDDGSYGTDTSNEMISIFFSPEGAFMLYTVCLTMMGLMLAKHPAGGGAGATVGVGFGTYFNVLPVWMLMLTVILLVVMAGVSIAVYYKGK